MIRSFVRAVQAFVLVALATHGVFAQQTRDPRAAILVSTAWLADHLRDPDLVLLHVGEKGEYDAGHLPGARFVTLQDISVSDRTNPNGLTLEMPAPEDLRTRLAALGIGDKSRVIVYYGNDWVTPTTRVMFTLDYAGLGANSALLDGGMQAWKREGREVTAEVPAAKTGQLSALKIRPIVVDAAWVRSHIGKPGIVVIDGRSSSFYDGVQRGGRPNAEQRAGHIAGARSVPFTEIADDRNVFKSANDLAALFKAAGAQPGDTIVGYCHIGQQATGMLFAARSLGYPVLLYDGSFEEWSAMQDAPVVGPPKK